MKQLYFKKHVIIAAFVAFMGIFAHGQIPSYYDGVNITTTGDALKSDLSVLIISTHTTSITYTPGVWDALKQTDLDPNNTNYVLLIYGYDDTDGDITNDRTRSKDLNGGNLGDWNREHVFPKSLGNPNLGTTGPGSDAHHLRSADVTLNAVRNNFPFVDGSGNAHLVNANSWYPGDEWKGDVARMIMYMYLRYGNQCLPSAVGVGTQNYSSDMMDIFLEWNAEDPVSTYEKNRNILLEGIQGNRNPFIDNPAFATIIWGGPQAEDRFNSSEVADTEIPSTPAKLLGSNTSQTSTVLSWEASTDNVGVVAYKIFNGNAQIFSTTELTYTVTELTPNTSYIFTVKAADVAGNVSDGSNPLTVTTLEGSENTAPIVFINEIHYDNTGADVGEAVEVAGTAGLDLTGWRIIPYNGFGGATYSPIGTFSGIIPNQSNGFGTMYVNISGLQNGAPDGLALVDNLGNIVQFLSYEGSMVATNGPANGMTSIDIGVSESGSEAVGLSLQLTGTGTDYNSFTWQAASANTYGNINSGQVFLATVVTLSAPTNLTAANIAKTAVDLSWEASTSVGVVSYEIFDGAAQIASTTGTSYTVLGLTPNTTHAFTVKATDADDNLSASSNEVIVTTLEDIVIPISPASVFINEIHYDNAGADVGEGVEIVGPAGTNLTGWSIVPYNGSGGTTYSITNLTGVIPDQMNGYGTVSVSITGLQNGAPDGLALVDGEGSVIQFLSYEGSFTATNGPATGMVSKDIGISQASSSPVGSSLQLIGKGTVYSDFTWAALDNTFGDINTGQKFGDLVFINEIHYDNAGTDVGEAIEVAGWAGTDLTDWRIEFYNGSGGALYGTISLTGIIPDQMDGYGTMYFSYNGIQNGSPDGLALVDATGKVIQFLSYEGTFTATNGVAAGMLSTDIGISEASTSPLGVSLQLTGIGKIYADFTWQAANNTFGGINAGQVFGDSESPLKVISIAAARASVDGTLVRVSGVLTVSDQFAGSAYIQDQTGAIAIFDKLVHGAGVFAVGDSITVKGTRSTYNGQLQLSPVTLVENNGLPNNPILPLTITLSEMVAHPAELVRIMNPSFPKPGDIMFGNANYLLSDASGTGELRIDNDVEEIVGLGQPETCSELVGVVGNYYQTLQLLPRFKSDIACASPYAQSGSDLIVSKDKTLDIVTWNVAWFGDEANSPAKGNPDSDQIQKEHVKNVLLQLNADIYGVEEVSDDVLFAQMVSEMPGYSYVLSEATSYPNDLSGTKQKVGFIYNTNTVEPVSSKVLLAAIHPYYNGGDASALTDFPHPDKSRFYASGRLPFMLTANVTIDGNKQQINVIGLHARANTGSTAAENLEKYKMRKYDVEVLKDSLDVYYPNANIIMVGDYNDDVDVTVSNVFPITDSSFKSYVDDSDNYNILTSVLSDQGFRSYVTYENMIDHIMVSNELSDLYIDESARVHYEFYSSTYTRTTSDHFPVSTRLQLKLLTLDEGFATDVTCNGASNGTASVTVSGGISPYAYDWSNGQSASTATGLSKGTYKVTVTDVLGAIVTKEFIINEPEVLEIITSENSLVYYGYDPESCITLAVTDVIGGVAPYTIEWNTGESEASFEVCPEETTTYTVIVTDANGCSVSKDIIVEVVNVQCGDNLNNHKVEICHNGKTICVAQTAVQEHLNHGDSLGSCDREEETETITNLQSYPNPFVNEVTIKFSSNVDTVVDLCIYDFKGQLVAKSTEQITNGEGMIKLNLGHLIAGFYYLKTIVNGDVKNVKLIIKQ